MNELYAKQQAARRTRQFPLDNFPGHAAWLDRGWKLHRHEPKDGGAPTWELYSLAADDRETTNLYDREPSRAAAMRAQLEAWLLSVARSHNGEDYRGQDR